MTRYWIITNPIAGRGACGRLVPQVEVTLRQAGLDYHLVQTERPWHAAELAQQGVAEGYDVVVAMGGDGTFNEVLNGLMRSRQPSQKLPCLGMICIGRGNDFAFGSGIPTNWRACCAALAAGARKTIDVGFLQGGDDPQGRFFGNGVGVGFDAVANIEAIKLAPLSGFLCYAIAALKTILLYFNAPPVQIDLDNEAWSQPSLMVSVMNGRRMGGGFMMAPESKSDDGRFDLCIAGAASRLTILYLITRFIQGTQAGHPAIRMARTRRITVTAVDGVLPAQIDGEIACTAGKHLEMEILPQALEIIYQA